ncbi:MAG TPA: hypothetical protein DHW02_18125 [Ktedonobacter sp.]|nr:hypothetical protein [Ktedonobacter sp.]
MAVNGQGEQGDLRVTLTVSQREAMEGTTRLLYLPDGRTLNVIIPPGTQSGQVIRIDGHGLPVNGQLGALLITVTLAQTEQTGSQMSPMDGSDAPTAFHAPPPPVSPQMYPGYSQYPNYNQSGTSVDYQTPKNGGQTVQSGANATPDYYTPVSSTPLSTPLPASLPSTPLATPSSSSYYAPGQLGPAARPPSRNARGSRSVMTVSVIIGLVVLLAASGLIYYAGFYLPDQRHKTSVQQTTVVQDTAIAQANSTGTAQASATAYPQTRYSQITDQQPAFSYSLSSNTANTWDENAHCLFTNGSYHAIEEQTGYFFYCMNNAQKYGNFAFQVKMTFLRGGLGGIMFRADVQNSKYYLLRFDRSGRYDLFLYVDSNVQHVKKLAGDVTDALSQSLNQPNLITLIVQGNTFALYINSQYVVTLTDPNSTFSSGNIGVTAEDYTDAAEISYQQAKLWKL